MKHEEDEVKELYTGSDTSLKVGDLESNSEYIFFVRLNSPSPLFSLETIAWTDDGILIYYYFLSFNI